MFSSPLPHYMCLDGDSDLSPPLQRMLNSRMKKGTGQGETTNMQQMDQDLLAIGGVLRFTFLPLRSACDVVLPQNMRP